MPNAPATPASSTTSRAPRAAWAARSEALEHLRQCVETEERFKQDAVGDPDFDAIRDDPEFSAITGQAGSAGAGS